MNETQETSLVPRTKLDEEALDELRKASAEARVWARVSRDKPGFTIGGDEDELADHLEGVIVGIHPCWASYDEDNEKFLRIYDKEPPEDGNDWKRRCDCVMITKKYGEVTLDLSPSGFKWGLGMYQRHLETFGLAFSDVLTITEVAKAKSKKFGKFNTVRFSIGQVKESAKSTHTELNPPPPEDEDAPPEIDDGDIPF